VSGPRELIVVGGGEHARVVIEAARSRPDLWTVTGFVDPQPCPETAERLDLPRIGDDGRGFEIARTAGVSFVLGVGAVGVSTRRQEIVKRYASHTARWAAVAHAQAWVSPTARVAPGAVVMAGAMVNAGARLGEHAVVNTGSVVEHDVVIGPFAQVAPGAAVGGGTVVEDGSYLGLGCRVRDHVHLGSGVMVGMGAVVVGSLAAGSMVVGVPARASARLRHA
jgi:acetyltransferase EpsM